MRPPDETHSLEGGSKGRARIIQTEGEKEMMKLISVHLVLQRPATEEEISEYEYYKEIFDSMDPEQRALNDIHRPADLAREADNPAKNVVYYGTRREPIFNEEYVRPTDITAAKAGANEAIKRILASMIAENRRPEHETFHASGEFEIDGVYIGFKNLAARSEFPVRGVRHRDARRRRR